MIFYSWNYSNILRKKNQEWSRSACVCEKSPNDEKKYVIIYCWAILSPSWSIIADSESPFCILSRLTTCVFELARNSSSFPGSRNDFTNEVISSVTSVFGLESFFISSRALVATYCSICFASASNLESRLVWRSSHFINSCERALISCCCSTTFASSWTREDSCSTRRFSH